MLKYKKLLTKEFLEIQYIQKELSTLKIAKEVGCNDETIRNYLQYFNIPRRTYKQASTGELNPMYGIHRFGKDNPNFKTGYCCEINKCIDCGKKLGDPRSTRCEYCSNIGKRNPAYIHGQGYLPYPKDFSIKLKEEIRKRDNFQCQNCNVLEINYYRILDVHHIDYNKFNCSKTNLITLCNKCNTKANGNRDYWFAYYTYIIGENYE